MARQAGWKADVHTAVACRQALGLCAVVRSASPAMHAGRHEQADMITAIASEGLQRPSRSIPFTSVRSIRAPHGAVELAADHAGFVVDEAGRAETVAAPPPLG
jgi:hypothetical protein